MKKIFGIAMVLAMISGSALAGDYWHFGMGARLTGVMPGDDYANALGVGVLLTFGNPDSRFTTQLDFDDWGVTYTKTGDTVRTSPPRTNPVTYKLRDKEYSGLGIGIFEKYRAFDFGSRLSTYILGGFGGYFLDFKREEPMDLGGTQLRSLGLHSLFMWAAGLGFEARLNDHLNSFVEGRYINVISGDAADADLKQGSFGMRYVF